MIRIVYRSFWLPKSGNLLTEYEDAFWPYCQQQVFVGHELRFAVADGATESSFARLWARMLVKAYCNIGVVTPNNATTKLAQNPTEIFGNAQVVNKLYPINFYELLKIRGRAWSKRIFAQPLDWFVLEKVQRGGFATLLGFTLNSSSHKTSKQGSWQAFAVGDSCLFQIRESGLVHAFPITHTSQFGSHPLLLSTNPTSNERLQTKVSEHTDCGTWKAGDDFLLMTDALAHWFLKAEEAANPWTMLVDSCNSPQRFEAWVNKLRQQHSIRNDDTTLIHIHLCEL